MDEPDFELFDRRCRLFPLPGVVLFPHCVLPLHIFEPRYRQMTEHALSGDGLVTIVQLNPPVQVEKPGGLLGIEKVACVGKILQHKRLPDGRFNFLLLGCRRVRLVRELPCATLYRQAEADLLTEVEPDPADEGTRDELVALFRACLIRDQKLTGDLDDLLRHAVSLGMLTDIIAHGLGLPTVLKQAFLEECRIGRRARGLLAILRKIVSPESATEPDDEPFPPPFSTN